MTYARNDAVGRYGEDVAARHLESLGMTILERRWTCRWGELDLVARDGGTVVFCEVKTRTSSRHGTGFEAVSGRKAARLRRAASAWLQGQEVQPEAVRIDVVSVRIPRRGGPVVERVSGVA
jgi:putative endonuclease